MKRLFILLLISSAAIADDIKTTDGAVHSGTVSRVEPDGVVLTSDAGIEKIPFTKVSEELQKKYGYKPEKAAAYVAAVDAAARQKADQAAAAAKQFDEALTLASIKIAAVITPLYFKPDNTVANIQQYKAEPTGEFEVSGQDQIPVTTPKPFGNPFVGVIDEKMPEGMEAQNAAVVVLYKIGHTSDANRYPLFTTSERKAAAYLQAHQ